MTFLALLSSPFPGGPAHRSPFPPALEFPDSALRSGSFLELGGGVGLQAAQSTGELNRPREGADLQSAWDVGSQGGGSLIVGKNVSTLTARLPAARQGSGTGDPLAKSARELAADYWAPSSGQGLCSELLGG